MRTAAIVVACALLAAGCKERDEARPTSAPTSAVTSRATASATTSASTAPKERGPERVASAVIGALTADGWVALVRKDDADASIKEPLALVTSTGERTWLPFSSAGDLSGRVARYYAGNLVARRFLYADGVLPKVRLHVWGKGDSDATVEGTFPLLGGAVVAETQALAVPGKMDKRGWVEQPNGPRAARYRAGAWTYVDLPPPAEPGWSSCFWGAAARPKTDEITLLQICAAQGREFAYALFRLAPDGDALTRVPFDNAVFTDPRAARGEFEIEDDGTFDLSSDVSGRDDGEMTLARLRPGKDAWQIVHVRMPTRLMSTVGVHGDHLLFTDGAEVHESTDGGASFHVAPWPTEAPGMLGGCNAFGCAFGEIRSAERGSHLTFRRW
ncbi:MAG TPA: hypothetical protein VGM56_12390 [Byssovorax sp.]